MKTLQFQLFGSEDSTDTDIIVFVDNIGLPHESSKLCMDFAAYLKSEYADKVWAQAELDVNLAILTDGYVSGVYKGTPDEVNNSLFLTYDLHEQVCGKAIKGLIERNIDIKALRAMRGLLSLVSRTSYRDIAKKGLKNGFIERIEALRGIPVSGISDLASKNMTMDNYYKVVAFQIGQTLGLLEGKELYSKSSIGLAYPTLIPFLYRQQGVVKELDKLQTIMLDKLEERIPITSIFHE